MNNIHVGDVKDTSQVHSCKGTREAFQAKCIEHLQREVMLLAKGLSEKIMVCPPCTPVTDTRCVSRLVLQLDPLSLRSSTWTMAVSKCIDPVQLTMVFRPQILIVSLQFASNSILRTPPTRMVPLSCPMWKICDPA